MAYASPRGIKRAQQRASINRTRRLRGSAAERAHRAMLLDKPQSNVFGLLRGLKAMLIGRGQSGGGK